MTAESNSEAGRNVGLGHHANSNHVVVLVHGIRDFALWQDSVRSSLEERGFIVEATNYGRLNLIQFLLPAPIFRNLAAKKIFRQMRIVKQNNPQAAISVIAHSFGTFVACRIVRKNFDFNLKRIILCGSVLPYDFDFENMQGRFVAPILNEVGTRDIWPAIAESLTFGYGSAGTYGFRRPLVRDRWHNGAHHGYFLDRDFCRKFWVPFLEDGTFVKGADSPEETRTWIRLFTIIKIRYLIVTAIALIFIYSTFWLKNGSYEEYYAPNFPRTQSYCPELKVVADDAERRFSNILGAQSGNNRIPNLPLDGWEDCIVFMETDFSSSRRYVCKVSGLPSQQIAQKYAERAARELIDSCFGAGHSINVRRDLDQLPYWRIVGRQNNAVITLKSSKNRPSQDWDLQIDVE